MDTTCLGFGAAFTEGGGESMETAKDGSQRELGDGRPSVSTDKTLGRTTTTGSERAIELEIPLDSVADVHPADVQIPKTDSPLRDALKRLTPWAKPAPAHVDDATDAAGGIHEITRATNFWFDREVAVLERDARTLAADWAGKGLPRHDVA